MVSWIAANAATIVISLVLIALIVLAARSVIKKKGCGCGNSACGGCSGCQAYAPKGGGKKL